MTPKKKTRKMTKSEVIGVRLDPKLRLAAELAAGKERRSLSSFIEWAVEGAVKQVLVSQQYNAFIDKVENMTAMEVVNVTWDVDEADRFTKRALQFSSLLTHDEQRLWKLICEHGVFWEGRFDESGYWKWSTKADRLLKKRVRIFWNILNAVAKGEVSEEELPRCKAHEDDEVENSDKFLPNIMEPKPTETPKPKIDMEIDDDIPF